MKRKIKALFLISVFIMTTLFFPTKSFAENEKHENIQLDSISVYHPSTLTLKDRFYLGVVAGYDLFRVENKIKFIDASVDKSFTLDPTLDVTGWTAGGLIGYGRYFDGFHNAYLGLEIFVNGSSADLDYQIISNNSTLFNAVNVRSTYGISFLPGIKLNNIALMYLRVGYNWSKININEIIADSSSYSTIEFDVSNIIHGLNYGLGLESAFYQDISLRLEYTHTNYSSFVTDAGTEIKPSNNQFMLGFVYHFL